MYQDDIYCMDNEEVGKEEVVSVEVQEEVSVQQDDDQSRMSSITGKEESTNVEEEEEEEEEEMQRQGVLTQVRERKSPLKKRPRQSIQQLRIDGQKKKQKTNNN
jgi:hypothetical protein